MIKKLKKLDGCGKRFRKGNIILSIRCGDYNLDEKRFIYCNECLKTLQKKGDEKEEKNEEKEGFEDMKNSIKHKGENNKK